MESLTQKMQDDIARALKQSSVSEKIEKPKE